MANENNGVSALNQIASALHVSLETFWTIVSVIFVVGISLYFLKAMFFANDVKDIYMNWEDITYISDYYDEKENAQVVDVVIESTRGFPYNVHVLHTEIMQSSACPIVLSDSVKVPTMEGKTLVLPYHFDAVYGYVKEYNKLLQEGD